MTRPFQPDWASPPVDTVRDILEMRGTSYELFCQHMKWNIPDSCAFAVGELRITEEIAAQLVAYLGSSLDFWLTRDKQYVETRAQLHDRRERIERLWGNIKRELHRNLDRRQSPRRKE